MVDDVCKMRGVAPSSFEEGLDIAKTFFEYYRNQTAEIPGLECLRGFLKSIDETVDQNPTIDTKAKDHISLFLADEYLWSRGYRDRLRKQHPNAEEEALKVLQVTGAASLDVRKRAGLKFYTSHWSILKNETTTPFLISDNPIVVLPTLEAQPTDYIDVGGARSVFLVPLSKDVLIIGTHAEKPDFRCELRSVHQLQLVEFFNFVSGQQATMEIYCGKKEPLLTPCGWPSSPNSSSIEIGAIAASLLLKLIESGAAF